MYIRRHFRILPAIAWTFEIIPAVGLWAGALTALHYFLDLRWIQLPAMPVTILGTAVAFYLGFKGSAAYGRLWEARMIWGGIVNYSRTWGVFVTSMVSDLHREEPAQTPLAEVHRELVYRHVAWLAALRTQLRRPKPWEHHATWNDTYRKKFGTYDNSDDALRRRIADFVSADELDAHMAQKNRATQLLRKQGDRLKDLYAARRIEDFRHMELARLLSEFYTLQGKCERIKNFPLPRQYATANHWFVMIFVFLVPLALLGAFHTDDLPNWYVWVTVPASIVLGWVFYLWDKVLEYSENPFEGLINDIPMDALSRTIEIDLREMLGETELPPPIQPIEGEALM